KLIRLIRTALASAVIEDGGKVLADAGLDLIPGPKVVEHAIHENDWSAIRTASPFDVQHQIANPYRGHNSLSQIMKIDEVINPPVNLHQKTPGPEDSVGPGLGVSLASSASSARCSSASLASRTISRHPLTRPLTAATPITSPSAAAARKAKCCS